MLKEDARTSVSGKGLPRKRQRILLRHSPSTFGVINALMTIQSTVHARFNVLVSSFDPLMFESLHPDRMLVEACQLAQATEELDKMDERMSDLEQENLELSMKITQFKTVEPLVMSYLKCQERLAELRALEEISVSEPKTIVEQRPIELVKLTKMKTVVAKQIEENASLEKQIANLEKRISLMKRKRSFVPVVRTPRRFERKNLE